MEYPSGSLCEMLYGSDFSGEFQILSWKYNFLASAQMILWNYIVVCVIQLEIIS
jgi:hypothetical protein